MKYIITESQKNKLSNIFQRLINIEMKKIVDDSMDWGLGEMEYIDEVHSVDRIEVDRVVAVDGLKVYVKIYCYGERYDFDFIRSEIQWGIEKVIPNVKIFIEDTINVNEFGPGIDY
jgi:hypothetical protein